MDKITHEVRLANWKTIVEQCNNRPQGVTVKQWLADSDINEKTYYYWLRRVRHEVYSQLNNKLPDMIRQEQKPIVTFAEIPVTDAGTEERSAIPFKADAVIRCGSLAVEISSSISDSLLTKLLEVAGHAR